MTGTFRLAFTVMIAASSDPTQGDETEEEKPIIALASPGWNFQQCVEVSGRYCSGPPRRSHARGHTHSLLHAARIGLVPAGNIERRAVIHGCADDRNAERDIDRPFEVD